jgi:hypothetical protein
LITGLPRSGTTLACHLINAQENTVALHEPIDPSVFEINSTRLAAVDQISNFLNYSRSRIVDEGVILTKQFEGRLPSNPVGDARNGLRKEKVSLEALRIEKPLDGNFLLVVKHNALFTALLEDLIDRVVVYGIVRNPLSVLASWQSVDFPVQQGRIPMGERFDKDLATALNECSDILERQMLVLEWFFAKFTQSLPSSNVIRYEEVIATNGSILESICQCAMPEQKLDEQLFNSGLGESELRILHDRLIQQPGIFHSFYSVEDIDLQFEKMLR